MGDMSEHLLSALVSSVLFSVVGIAVFALAFFLRRPSRASLGARKVGFGAPRDDPGFRAV